MAPINSIPVHNRAFNFYLPVPFEKSLRVEVVQRQPSFWLWFCQMDYRLNDASLGGARLVTHGEGKDLSFSYLGLEEQRRQSPASSLSQSERSFPEIQIKPGEEAKLAQSYYRTGFPNPDFPGLARFFRQLAVPAALHLHFTGAGGNIGAGKYNDGSPENRLVLAQRLAEGMRRAWDSTQRQPISATEWTRALRSVRSCAAKGS